MDYSYSVSYLEKTIITEGESKNIEDLSPLEPSVGYVHGKTITEYWVPYHEIIKCKIYFKKNIYPKSNK